MDYRPLGRTGLKVSTITLGTMTWGNQNTEAEGHAQMDRALELGVNFWDTAEMYPVPAKAETSGRTEEIIGTWFASRKRRSDVILASKAGGPNRGMDHIRGGRLRYIKAHIDEAIEGNLKRLQTDYIDLYQLHWPERKTNMFGQLGYTTPPSDPDETPLEVTLDALDRHVKAGRIRAIGVSNDTPWGVMKMIALSEKMGLPRVASIQNPYSLLNRSFEVGLAEVAIREDVGLLAYSPLGMGVLSGKYVGGVKPEGARLTLFTGYTRYSNPQGIAATEKYVAIARKHGLDPSQMALAYIHSRPFTTSVIIGATKLDQLEADIAAYAVKLSDEVLAEIEAVHKDYVYPCP